MDFAILFGGVVGTAFGVSVVISIGLNDNNFLFAILDWADAQKSFFMRPAAFCVAFLATAATVAALVCGGAALGIGLGYLVGLLET